MPIEVIVLERGGVEPLAQFRIEEGGRPGDENWQEVSDLARNSRICLEMFFCYLGSDAQLHDRVILERLIQQSDNFAAGAKIYVVLDRRLVSPMDLDWHVESLHRWLASALDLELDDVLEDNLEPVNPKLLRIAAERSRHRHETLAALPTRGWLVMLSRPSSLLAEFLAPFVAYRQTSPGMGRLILVEEVYPEAQRRAAEEWLQGEVAATTVIATLGHAHKQPLIELCQEKAVPRLRLRGFFELRFLLMRLNKGLQVSISGAMRNVPAPEGL